MLDCFQNACEHLKREQTSKVWQDGYHAELIYSNAFIKQKVEYIYNNPVKDKIVTFPENYYFSSSRNYAALDNDLEVVFIRFVLKWIVGTDCKSALWVSVKENLEINLNSFLSSHIHMMINRQFTSRQREYEILIYDHLYRYYKTSFYRRVNTQLGKDYSFNLQV